MADSGQDHLLGTPVGERIKTAREARGLSLDEVARQTRIPIRHLQHIERGEWDALPAITYSVGFVRAYANAVGLDGPALSSELRDQLGNTTRSGSSTSPAAFYEPADPARVPPRSLAIAAAVFAVLIVVGYLIWRSHAVGDDAAAPTPVAEAPAPTAGAPATGAAKPAAAPAAAAPTGGPVVLTAAEPVWLRVYEAGGAKLYEGTMKGGDRYEVPSTAQAPQILTGRPNVLRITVGTTQIPALGPPERRVKDISLKAADLLGRLRSGAPAAAPAPSAVPPAQ